MIEYLKKDRWPAYLVGLLIGLLLTAVFFTGHQIGVSSGVARISALLEQAFAPEQIGGQSYFQGLLKDHIVFDWKILFIVGLFFGSLIASKLCNEKVPSKNSIWNAAFGPSITKRYAAAFIGGLLLMFGARIADGCTSGHAISGGAQLSITSWIFMLSLFATAIPVSFFLYKNK